MSAKIKQNRINVREKLNSIPQRIERLLPPQWFIGDGVKTDFPIDGDPFQVFNAGFLVKEGVGDEYTFGNGVVKFAVAPALNNDIAIFSKVFKS